MKVRRRIEAARGWEAERDREALPDRLEEIQEAGLGGLPSGVWRPIQDHLAPKEQARLAAVSGYINNALGGGEKGPGSERSNTTGKTPPSLGENGTSVIGRNANKWIGIAGLLIKHVSARLS